MSSGITFSRSICPKTQDGRTHMSMTPYASAIGSIIYAMLCTRPNVSYALSVIRKYQFDPSKGHWAAVKNILKYLKMSKDVFLIYGDENLLLAGIPMPTSNMIKMTSNLNQVMCSH